MTTHIDQGARPQTRWRRKLYGYLALARISNSPTVASNVLAGAALAGMLTPDLRLGGLVIAMVLFYTAGMYLNDLCDYAIDLYARPERPLPAGLISRQAAGAITAALFIIGAALLWPLGAAALTSGLLLAGLIIAYDLWHKSNPLSPLLMASCRLMVYVTAFLAFAPRPTSALLGAGALLTLYVVGLTYIAKQENRSSLVAYWPAAALFLPALVFIAQLPGLWALPLLLLFIGWVAYSIAFVYRRKGRSIGRAIGQLIAGISLVDALVLALAGSGVGVALALGAFGLTIFFQRYIKGT